MSPENISKAACSTIFSQPLTLQVIGTGKGGMWREKLPDAESASWGRFPESVGESPHLSGARGVGLLLFVGANWY